MRPSVDMKQVDIRMFRPLFSDGFDQIFELMDVGICSYCEPPNFNPNNQDFANYNGSDCNGEDPNTGVRNAPFVTDYSNETTCAKEISCEFANNDRLFLIYTYPPANMTTCSNVGSSEGPVMLSCNENHEFTDSGGVYIFNSFVCRNSSSV
ncbi:hypothetical protein WR25_05237 [Diploscapter pachys]|uniref:Uncharacterized protein n=1 Tax=Diploscapter pachys TaxID=2018661 RepID=A0A2A2L857_9BILA|nr:hypothetical protein WR25_05237 [Diploscapter pachys]